MKKPLSEMSLEELWRLFPIVLKKHNPKYKKWYLAEKKNIFNSLEGIKVYRISHIGSTAIPGLKAKPTVDILLETHSNCNLAYLKERLKSAGWLLMNSQDEPYMELAFNKGYTPEGFAKKVYHLHVRYKGDWDELYFRDYLMLHKDAVKEYGKLKEGLLKRFEHDRDGYTGAKTEFIKKHTEAARRELGTRYKA